MGTGCAKYMGDQYSWLLGTLIFQTFAIALELFDGYFFLYRFRNANGRNGLRRPWCTGVLGLGVYGFLIGVGYKLANQTPLSEPRVAIFGDIEAMCHAELLPAGVRGAIIGWADGVFAGFGHSYTGPSTNG